MREGSGAKRAAIYLFLIVAILLEVRKCHQAPPEVPAEPEVQEEQTAIREMMDWQLKAAREAMAHSLAKLTTLTVSQAQEVVLVVEREADKYDLDPFRILAFIIAESHGDTQAISIAGAKGLMQIMPQTGQFIATALTDSWQGDDSLFEIETNISYGVWYYHYLLQTFEGNEQAALAAYNWGPQNIKQRILKGERLPSVYPSKVLEAEDRLEREFSDEATNRFWSYLNRDDSDIDEGGGAYTASSSAPDCGLLCDSGEGS